MVLRELLRQPLPQAAASLVRDSSSASTLILNNYAGFAHPMFRRGQEELSKSIKPKPGKQRDRRSKKAAAAAAVAAGEDKISAAARGGRGRSGSSVAAEGSTKRSTRKNAKRSADDFLAPDAEYQPDPRDMGPQPGFEGPAPPPTLAQQQQRHDQQQHFLQQQNADFARQQAEFHQRATQQAQQAQQSQQTQQAQSEQESQSEPAQESDSPEA